MNLFEKFLDELDELFRDPERYIRKYWWLFIETDSPDMFIELDLDKKLIVWPVYWGHNFPIGGDKT